MIYDVAIIGAGPAGATVAFELEKSGYKIVILDKEKFPRNKPCAGVLPPRIYSEVKVPTSVMERPLDGYRIFSPEGVTVESTFSQKGLIVRRDNFDYFLIKRLKTKVRQIRVLSCVRNKDFIEVAGDGGTIRAKLVVGADGVNSVVRRMCNIDASEPMEKALAVQYEISLSGQKIDKRIGNWFEVYYTIPFGYGWVSPLKDTVKVGVGSVSADYKRSYKKTLNEFLEQSIIKEKILDGEIVGMESHFIPMGGPLNKLTANRAILVGDAGGFVFSGTGEGIYYAIKSGRVAAEAICQALEEGQFDGDFLGKLYAEKLEKSGLSSLREVDFAEKVLSSPKKAEKYVRRLKKLSIE